jgi:hypothetical protein
MSEIGLTKVLSIREAGHDEYWLRDRIYDDPTIIGLGELQAVMKEKAQSQGGRLDLLLKDPSDDSMYEVEIQLGSTDESHIIRTIEYWDNEKRKWPNRSHTAVLIAEEITSRFFNVVHLLSQSVPIVGIQVSIVKVQEATALHFTKIIDSFEEPEDEEPQQEAYTEKHWIEKYPGVLACANWYRDLLLRHYPEINIKYFKHYISLIMLGTARVWINKRNNNRALIEIKCLEDNLDKLSDTLNSGGISFSKRSSHNITFNVNLKELKEKENVHDSVAVLIATKADKGRQVSQDS